MHVFSRQWDSDFTASVDVHRSSARLMAAFSRLCVFNCRNGEMPRVTLAMGSENCLASVNGTGIAHDLRSEYHWKNNKGRWRAAFGLAILVGNQIIAEVCPQCQLLRAIFRQTPSSQRTMIHQ
jgi:hypothetical protein